MALSYTPLDESKDEIRLLTLLPKSGRLRNEIIQCRLETRSLTSFTPQYEEFASSQGYSGSDKHMIMQSWIRSRLESEGSLQNLSPTTIREPPNAYQRFNWGDFAALSYVWGDESKTRIIIVNGCKMEVTRNLEQALRAFRANSEFHSNFGLWVDAICINQKDLEERGCQVRKMRNIYGRAWTVIAWLGEAANQSNEAIQLIHKLSLFHYTKRRSELARELVEQPGYLGDGCWHALLQLMERPYWYRLWIIQEIIMGASAMVLRCGTASIDWISFCSGLGVLQEDLWLIKDNLLSRDLTNSGLDTGTAWSTTSLHLIYRDLSVLCQRDKTDKIDLPFWRVIDIANTAECRDPRDKVYGLIGLMAGDVGKRLVPDYSISPREVYIEIAKVYMQSYQILDPIREGNPWGQTKTPSWVADWMWDGGRCSLARIENRLWGPAWLSGNLVPDSSSYQPYEASGRSACEICFPETGLLKCSGFVIDSIAGLSARGRGYFAWSKSTIKQPKEWTSIYGNTKHTSKALYQTLVADRISGGKKSSNRHSSILSLPSTFEVAEPQFEQKGWAWLASQENYYFRWEEWRKANRNFQLGHLILHDLFSDTLPADALEEDYTEVYSCFDRTCQKRRFMLTDNGYMGWAPDNIYGSSQDQAKVGDLIAILFGCSTPIIIRTFGEHFQVVGEGYVQGIMDGEAMKFLNEGKFKREEFTFC